MPYRRTRSWREWFFEVFAPNSRMPFEPLPMTDAECREREEQRDIPEDITRLGLTDQAPPQSD
jgi:hypothetical protein